MSSVFCPDGGYPRLIRFVDPGTLPGSDLLALYDENINLLIIDRALYEQLSPMEKRHLLRTTQPVTRFETTQHDAANDDGPADEAA